LKTELWIPEEAIYIYADEFWIEQVVNNFLNNAIRHTPEYGSVSVKVTVDELMARVEIENEGSRIREDELENIWLKFYKVDKSRSRNEGKGESWSDSSKGSGTGLGLAIVSNILLLHSAKYGVENTRTGVRFYFELSRRV
jgi:two-component system, OmpR family, sensor histidine kinase VanS